MELQVYKLIAKSKLYQSRYTIRAVNIQTAIKKAKERFSHNYGVYGDDIKIQLDQNDLTNHIEEILQAMYNAK